MDSSQLNSPAGMERLPTSTRLDASSSGTWPVNASGLVPPKRTMQLLPAGSSRRISAADWHATEKRVLPAAFASGWSVANIDIESSSTIAMDIAD